MANKPIRNDSVLYSGINSQTFKTEKEKREAKQEERSTKRAQLQPYEQIIEQEIAKLRQEIALELGDLIHADMKKTDVKSVVLGLRLADSKLVSLRARLSNILRKRQIDEVSDADL